MSTLTITLPPGPPSATAACLAVLGDDTGAVTRHVEAPLALLPQAAGGETVAVLMPEQLSWHRVDLPKGALANTGRLRTVLEGLLEDRLLDEPQHLHFALQPHARAGAPLWVATCDRAWLRAWLQALEQSGRTVSRIVPLLAPGAADGDTTVLATGTPEQARVYQASPDGVAVLPLDATGTALLHSDSQTSVFAEPGVAELTERLLQGPVTLQTAPQQALAAAGSDWDLAQFEFLRTRQARTRQRLLAVAASLWRAPHWRPARWSALALVLVNLIGLQAWAWKEQSALAAKRSAIQAVLTSTFPDVRVVVDAPAQMARALADLQRQSGATSSRDLETMLGLFQALAPELGAPQAIEFVASELRLKLPTLSDTVVAGLSTRLQAQGFGAQLRGDSLVITPERKP
jgi:general secretion pathway protein L